ncbi:hypothetical protein F3J20_01755 [Paraburkholderia sp. Cy-641]|uniref:hypothetical protein n=1 Tax=Paraburkholderia sp. Cy-641 TaxID=2608337 RepID=UPI0014233BE5|nr:hypothetical protein [Paraburkholderia sp. Cy-641]NIF76130.1 hypothetical protein [Paraburkholderia sp. Cy-641]
MARPKSALTVTATCIKIPLELKAQAKIVEQKTGATLSGIVRVALTRYLNEMLAKEQQGAA